MDHNGEECVLEQNAHISQPGVVTQVCNPSYLGGRDPEVRGSRQAQAKVCETPPISTNG
jgi:hypothetical protein